MTVKELARRLAQLQPSMADVQIKVNLPRLREGAGGAVDIEALVVDQLVGYDPEILIEVKVS